MLDKAARVVFDSPDPANPALLVGKAYLAFGQRRLRSNFFVLAHLRPPTWKP